MDNPLPIQPIVDEETAFAFLLGVLFNQQIRAQDAWLAPYRLGQRIGKLTPSAMLIIGLEDLEEHFASYPAIHPFVKVMARNTYNTAHVIADHYEGDARNLWKSPLTASEFISRFTALPGIGEHKARIALFVATTQLGIKVRADGGEYSIRSCGSLARLFHPIHEPSLEK